MTAIVQTYALSGHIVEDTGNLVRVGPESAAQFLRVRDATVTYQVTTGGPTYTDTIPGLQAAVVYGSNPAVTTVDARLARYVTFITPAYGGVPPLQVATEGAYNFLSQQGYVIPLDICYLHHWNYYQNTGGVVLPPPGGSFAGGAVYGDLNSRSFSGGGSIPSNGAYYGHNSTYGCFFKAHALPTTKPWQLIYQSFVGGFLDVSLWADGTLHVYIQGTPSGGAASSASAGVPGTAIPLDTWLWLSTYFTGDQRDNSHYLAYAALWDAHGQIVGSVSFVVPNTGNPAFANDQQTGGFLVATPPAASTTTLPPPTDGTFRVARAAVFGTTGGNPIGFVGPPRAPFGATIAIAQSETPGTYQTLAAGNGQALTAASGSQFTVYPDGPLVGTGISYTVIGSALGLFVKATAYPATTTALLDLDCGAGGYLRIILTPAGAVYIEMTFGGGAVSINLTAGAVLPLHQYVWITLGAQGDTANNPAGLLYAAVIGQAGTVIGSVGPSTAYNIGGAGTFTGVLNMGVSRSNPAYLSVPADGSILLSKVIHGADAGSVDHPAALPRPTADRTGDTEDYLCRDGIGAAPILHDSSPNHHDAVAGAQGLIIKAEGPYA